MLTLILLTSLTQILPEPELGFNLTLPQEFTTTTPEPIDFMEDFSGEENDTVHFPKSSKKGKKAKKSKSPKKVKGVIANSTMEYNQSNPGNSAVLAVSVGLISIGLLGVIYKIRQRKSGYSKINHEPVESYGTIGDGTW